jgi:hypothetical protein
MVFFKINFFLLLLLHNLFNFSEDLKIRFNVLRMAYLNIMSNYFYDFQDESNEITKTNAIEGIKFIKC